MNNLFNSETGNTVMIPMDHGLMLGVQPGLEDPVQSLKNFASLQPDAILMNFGILKLTRDYLSELDDRPGIILEVDFNETWEDWKKPIDREGIIGHCKITDMENAAKYGADAVKVLFPLGLDPETQLDHMRHTAEIVNEAERYEMPVMLEPVTMGSYISEERKNDPAIIADGSRIALELGADILKAPYLGEEHHEEFRALCQNSHVPVVMLGGPKRGGVKGILETAERGVEAGARGPIFGRNVWQRPEEEMRKVVKSLQDIVHEGAETEEVMKKYAL